MQPASRFALSEGQRAAFAKALSALSAKCSVPVRVDGDGVFNTATVFKNIVTAVTHRHAAPI